MTEDITAFPDRLTRETLYNANRLYHRRLVIIAVISTVLSNLLLGSILGFVLLGIKKEQEDVHQHRVRNEQLHEAVCHRQDEIADAMGFTMHTPCPPLINLNSGLERR